MSETITTAGIFPLAERLKLSPERIFLLACAVGVFIGLCLYVLDNAISSGGGEESPADYYRHPETAPGAATPDKADLVSPGLSFPRQAEMVSLGQGQQIFFSWEASPGNDSYTILISESAAFETPVIRKNVKHNYFIYDHAGGELKETSYYWTVLRTDGDGNNSPIIDIRYFITRQGNPRQELLSPPDDHIAFSSVSPEIRYSWNTHYPYPTRFQIAAHPDFSGELLVDEFTNGGGSEGWFLPPGTYFWRVSTELPAPPGKDSPEWIDSTPKRLVILPSFPAPEIISPGDAQNLGDIRDTPVVFQWRRQILAEAYDFRLFGEGSDIPLLEITSIGDTSVGAYFSPGTAGKFHWTIQAYTSEGAQTPRRKSLVKSHQFTVGAPGAKPVPGFVRGVVNRGTVRSSLTLMYPGTGASLTNIEESLPIFSWAADEPLRNVRVLFSREANPAGDPRAIIRYMKPDETSLSLPELGAGLWYWTVEGDNQSNQSISAAAPSWFTLQSLPPLAQPRYIEPGYNDVITLEQLMEDRRLSFNWEMVPGANGYIFSLYGLADKEELLFSTSPSPETSFVLTDLSILTLENYIWQVEAVSVTRNGTIERRGILSQYSFMVTIPQSDSLQTNNQGTFYGY